MGPATPAKKMPNATGMVTIAASQAVPETAVPIVSTTLPTTASPACAISLSRLVPPNDASTRLAKPPNVANRAICTSPMTLKVSANRAGTTSVARSARSAADTDHVGRKAVRPAAAETARPEGGQSGQW